MKEKRKSTKINFSISETQGNSERWNANSWSLRENASKKEINIGVKANSSTINPTMTLKTRTRPLNNRKSPLLCSLEVRILRKRMCYTIRRCRSKFKRWRKLKHLFRTAFGLSKWPTKIFKKRTDRSGTTLEMRTLLCVLTNLINFQVGHGRMG